MTGIWFSRRDFEYDVHSLVKAFYLKEDVTIITDETPSDIRLKISVFYEEKQIRIRFEHILPGSGADMEEKTEIYISNLLLEKITILHVKTMIFI